MEIVHNDNELNRYMKEAVKVSNDSPVLLDRFLDHATEVDVQKGLATKEDRYGNDQSDARADDGVRDIAGIGLVKLADWTAKRYIKYRKFMIRIQRFIATVLSAEKEERAKGKQVDKMTRGYDPDKWINSNVRIRREDRASTEYTLLNLPPPNKG